MFVKNLFFEQMLRKKAQQNETLHPKETTHISIDQGIFQVQKAYPPHANAVGRICKTVTD